MPQGLADGVNERDSSRAERTQPFHGRPSALSGRHQRHDFGNVMTLLGEFVLNVLEACKDRSAKINLSHEPSPTVM